MTGPQAPKAAGQKTRVCGYQGIRSVPSRGQAPGAEIIQVAAPQAAAILLVALANPTVRSRAQERAATSSRSSFRSMSGGVQISTPNSDLAWAISSVQSPYCMLTRLT